MLIKYLVISYLGFAIALYVCYSTTSVGIRATRRTYLVGLIQMVLSVLAFITLTPYVIAFFGVYGGFVFGLILGFVFSCVAWLASDRYKTLKSY
ncbi:MAG: hypothetical protein PHV25_01055 [Candidatus Pacebacteria bacterium]|nr:hypothetical protein [Candidatus Paceibacterota bacterium]